MEETNEGTLLSELNNEAEELIARGLLTENDKEKIVEIAFRGACSGNKDEFHCYPIHFSDKSRQEISTERRHYMSGEYDGVRWHVDFDSENAMLVVTATDGKREYEERLEWVHEPVFGIDVTDANRVEEVLDRLVSKCKSGKFGRLKDWFRKTFKNR
jgi:hypothetical protein